MTASHFSLSSNLEQYMSQPEGNSSNLAEWLHTFISNCCKCLQEGGGMCFWHDIVPIINTGQQKCWLVTEKGNFYPTHCTNVIECVSDSSVYILLRQSASETFKKFLGIYSSFKTVTSINKNVCAYDSCMVRFPITDCPLFKYWFRQLRTITDSKYLGSPLLFPMFKSLQ
jgi:hypothetical protein